MLIHDDASYDVYCNAVLHKYTYFDASYDVYYNVVLHKYTYFANVKYLSGIRTGRPNTTSAV